MTPDQHTEATGKEVPPRVVGQAFNPYKFFTGIFIPEQICRYKGLSTGAKLIYGRLCRYAGGLL